MDEFMQQTRNRARESIRQMYGTEPELDPILELIFWLLLDEAGGVLPVPEVPITTDQWMNWHQLVFDSPEELVKVMTSVLEMERMELPSEQEAMRTWAASLLLETLDRIEMM